MAQSLFDEAFRLHSDGRVREAEGLYRAVLAEMPGHFDALHLLGVSQVQQGRHAEAAELITQAIAVNPRSSTAYANKGAALIGLGRHGEALAAFDQALDLEPGSPQTLAHRGAALNALGRLDEALAALDLALAADPGHAVALSNRGNVLHSLLRREEALASYDRALESMPRFADALSNRSATLLELGRAGEALDSAERALALRPRFAQALFNRGNALRELGQVQAAVQSYDHAIALDPLYAQACFNRANLLLETKQYELAAQSYARVFELGQDYPYAVGNWLDAKLQTCNWSGYAEAVGSVVQAVRADRPGSAPFAFLAISSSPADQLQCARAYAVQRCPPAQALWPGARVRHDRIRLAYVSATFHDHPASRLMAGLLEAHDKTRFEVCGVSYGGDDGSALRGRLQAALEPFIDARGLSDLAVAQRLREMEIDIVIDLDGYAARQSRPGVLAHRPAPLQVNNCAGYPGTTGASHIDYIFADHWVIPPSEDAHYAEKVVRLPHCYQPNDSRRRIGESTPSRAEAGLPPEGFVFCCFNNNYKITSDVFAIWMRLLGRVEGSLLWLLEDNAAAARNLRRAASEAGVAEERLAFAPRMALAEHLARHRLADLFLDTLPYTAHVTASDALWAGLPLLTCTGTTFAGRVAGSLLNALGLPELVTQHLAEYEERALALATDAPRLAAIRATLARERDARPLFDTKAACRAAEAAYLTMWQRHEAGLPPAAFDVPAAGA